MHRVSIVSCCKTRGSPSKSLARLALGFSIALLAAHLAAAQYGGGGGTMGSGTPGYTPPKGGYSSAKGAGIGAEAAAGAGALFLVLYHRGFVTGCVENAEDGLRLLDEKKKNPMHWFPAMCI